MLRFSLLTLLGVVLIAAIGSAALANPTDTWRQAVVTGAVVILLAAVLFAVSKRPASPFALGFTVTGCLYLVLTFSGVLDVREHLLTERASQRLWHWVHPESGSPAPKTVASPFVSLDFAGVEEPQILTLSSGHPPQASPPPIRHNFTVISRALCTLILATVGGLFASWIRRRRDTAIPPPVE